MERKKGGYFLLERIFLNALPSLNYFIKCCEIFKYLKIEFKINFFENIFLDKIKINKIKKDLILLFLKFYLKNLLFEK